MKKKYVFVAFCFVALLMPAILVHAQHPVFKIDFNMSGRQLKEVNETNYSPWAVLQAASDSCKFEAIDSPGDSIKIVLRAIEPENGILRSSWYKTGAQSPYFARLVSDGFYIDGGGGSRIEMKISGLPKGIHTFQSYHNIWGGGVPADYPPLNVYINGNLVHDGVVCTVRALLTSEATTLLSTAEVSDTNKEVVFVFESQKGTSCSLVNQNVFINGLEINSAEVNKLARNPIPADGDMHIDAGKGSYTLGWLAASNAVKHHLYVGLDSIQVAKATTSVTDLYKGALKDTSYVVSDLYNLNTYYWRVDEEDAEGAITKGDIWHFSPRHLAFPGAEGYGRFARGGRGGKVVYVTNLNDDGPGSLREAVTSGIGARTVMFAISGIIPLKDRLTVAQSNVTIAGQTAPGKGICVKGAPFGFSGAKDAIMRFMRVRVGSGRTFDGSGMTGSDHCIFDHNSFSWAIDEVFSSRSGKNFTLQKTMLAEALNAAGHQNYPDGAEHGYAASVGGDIGSFHHNLLIHCYGRNWSLAGGLDGSGAYSGRLDVFNNVVYNWGSRATDGGAHQVNFVNNYYKKGAGTKQLTLLKAQLEGTGTGSQSYYYAGNIMAESNGKLVYDGTDNTKGREYVLSGGQILNWDVWVDKPFFESHARIESAVDAYKSVLSDVGCTLPIFDDHDVRMINEALAGTYSCKGSRTNKPGFPDSQEDVGGWENYPEIAVDLDKFDTDRDGLPNWWEEMYGLNPNSPSGDFSDSNADDDKDGYTNLEVYLNWLAIPHYTIETGRTIDINLAPYARGYEKSPVYSVVSTTQGVSTAVNGSTLSVTSDAGFGGIVYIDFKVTDAEGSSSTRSIAVKIGDRATSIHSGKEDNKWKVNVYPNPVKDRLSVSLSGNDKVNLFLMDAFGGLVLTKTSSVTANNTCSLDVSSISAGVYFLKVQQGKQSETIKVIKK